MNPTFIPLTFFIFIFFNLFSDKQFQTLLLNFIDINPHFHLYFSNIFKFDKKKK